MKYVLLVGLLAVVCGGCGMDKMYTELEPGADKVLVTQNPDVVKGGQLVKSGHCSLKHTWIWYPNRMTRLFNYAKNFTHQAGGNYAYINTDNVGTEDISEVIATIEAYRVPDGE